MPVAEGFVQELAELASKAQLEARQTFLQSLAIDPVAPVGMELSRAGRRFHIAYNGTAPTGIAPVQAWPTTAAQWAIWNGDSAKSHVWETLGVLPQSGTPGVGGVLLACIFQAPAETGFATGLAVASASSSAIGSKASIKSGVTVTTPATPSWFVVADNQPGAVGAGIAGNQIVNRGLAGRIIVPPNAGLGLAVLALAGTTPLFVPYGEWSELVLPLK
jgi:hypothetical protein